MALEKTITAADQALSQVITEALPTIGAAVGFLKAEVTDVVHQLLMWKLVYHVSVGMLLLVVAAIPLAAIWIYRKRCISLAEKGVSTSLWKSAGGEPVFRILKSDWDIIDPGVKSLILGAALAGSSWVAVTKGVVHLLTAIQIWVAPKIYLIEYAVTLYQSK